MSLDDCRVFTLPVQLHRYHMLYSSPPLPATPDPHDSSKTAAMPEPVMASSKGTAATYSTQNQCSSPSHLAVELELQLIISLTAGHNNQPVLLQGGVIRVDPNANTVPQGTPPGACHSPD